MRAQRMLSPLALGLVLALAVGPTLAQEPPTIPTPVPPHRGGTVWRKSRQKPIDYQRKCAYHGISRTGSRPGLWACVSVRPHSSAPALRTRAGLSCLPAR
jgi:hypothetical protein